MRAPIHSDKHYVQMSLFTTATVAITNQSLALAVEGTAASTNATVVEGSIIKAVYIELWTLGSSADGSQIAILSKESVNRTGPTFAEAQSLGTFVNKKNILFVHQGLSANDGVGNPVVVIRQWFKIPKGKQRFGLGDRLVLSISNPSLNTLTACGFATFKEYT